MCRYHLLQALQSIDALLIQANGVALQEYFSLCHPVNTTNGNEMSFFYETLIDYIIEYIGKFQ